MGFERFTGKQTRGVSASPGVSLTRGGAFIVNRAGLAALKLSAPTKSAPHSNKVNLFWDEATRTVGIQATTKPDAQSYSVTIGKKSGGVISAGAFMGFYNIDRTKTRSVDLKQAGAYHTFEAGAVPVEPVFAPEQAQAAAA
jgi:hypothetical protein